MTQHSIENTDLTATFPDIKSPFIGSNPPGRRELLARIEVLEMRMDSQGGGLSRLTLRVAARERQAKILKAQADDEDIAAHLVKKVSFRLSFTVAEMATHFEVNPEAIRAHLYDYAHHMANDQIADYCRSPWPGGITKIDILSTDLVEIT